MSTITISNQMVDQETATLVAKTYEAIPAHWRAIIPSLTVMIADKPFNSIPNLREFCEYQNRQLGWEESRWKHVQAVCPEFDEMDAVLWVRYNRESPMYPPDYYFQKEFFACIAKLVWHTSKKLRAEVKKQATGMAAKSDGAAYLAFRDTFSRFFFNPEYLRERKGDAWSFMVCIDRALAMQISNTRA